MAKLWQKNYDLNKIIEHFTVGNDFILDQSLIPADCIASIAHAKMLASINILTEDEYKKLTNELLNIIELANKNNFKLNHSDEDCHTAIENYLIKKTGATGKKIHTGRSRNDQVLAALRLFSRDFLIQFQENLLFLINTLLSFAEKNKNIPMPGRTHMQIAMPSSVGLWAGAYAEQLLDDFNIIKTAYNLNNMCPLGSAASYGVPLPINRELVSDLLGFNKVQNNVLYVNNSRGKIESIITDALSQVILSLSKIAQDLILFSLPEFGYFSLPAEICTGSSIMPQKKNPDGLELIRAKAHTVCACSNQIKSIISSLPSGYNRDFQETKDPFMKAIDTSMGCLILMITILERIEVNKANLLSGFTPAIFATEAAFKLVREGIPFRDAYSRISKSLNQLDEYDPVLSIKKMNYTGTTGNLGLTIALNTLEIRKKSLKEKKNKIRNKIKELTGCEINLYTNQNK